MGAAPLGRGARDAPGLRSAGTLGLRCSRGKYLVEREAGGARLATVRKGKCGGFWGVCTVCVVCFESRSPGKGARRAASEECDGSPRRCGTVPGGPFPLSGGTGTGGRRRGRGARERRGRAGSGTYDYGILLLRHAHVWEGMGWRCANKSVRLHCRRNFAWGEIVEREKRERLAGWSWRGCMRGNGGSGMAPRIPRPPLQTALEVGWASFARATGEEWEAAFCSFDSRIVFEDVRVDASGQSLVECVRVCGCYFCDRRLRASGAGDFLGRTWPRPGGVFRGGTLLILRRRPRR